MTTDATNQRKIEHIEIAANHPGIDREKNHFEAIRLTHRALPEVDLDEIDTSCEFLGKPLSFPLLISGMTGGDHEQARAINRNLAIAAERAGIAMCVGSQRVMFTNPGARDSFDLRPFAPTIPLMANLGAVQLNHGFGPEHCREAIGLLDADALYLHLNPLQEAVQPRGDTHFKGLTLKLVDLLPRVGKPVIIKEVGCGISRADALALRSAGISMIDLAGAGGTSWSYIEHQRNESDAASPGFTLRDWGIPTPHNLRLLRGMHDLDLIASGGLRSGVDMVKSLVLGARLCGMARPFLRPAMESADAVFMLIERLRREFRTVQFLLGIARARDLRHNTALLLDGPECDSARGHPV